MRARIAPSLLSADFARLGRDIKIMEDAGAEILHIDVMDGHFVPNLTIGLPVLEAIRKETRLQLDVHLMISNPDERAVDYARAGADWVTVHIEAVRHLHRVLDEIRKNGARAGVALNPHSPIGLLEEILPCCDLVLIMSVNPGFGGQQFIPTSFAKIRALSELMESKSVEPTVEIDGGIDLENAADAVRAGAEILVSGSAIFGASDPATAYRKMSTAVLEGSRQRQNASVKVP